MLLLGALVVTGLSPEDSWLSTASLVALGILARGMRLPVEYGYVAFRG